MVYNIKFQVDRVYIFTLREKSRTSN